MRRCILAGLLLTLPLVACRKPSSEPTAAGPAPVTSAGTAKPLRFWHTQSQENQTALDQIIADFNAAHPGGPPIEGTLVGSYPELYDKIKASAADPAHADLPDLAVAYESMLADYMTADIVRPLDDLAADPEIGLSDDDQADIFASFLERNRFAQFDGQLLSFPFTTSVLLLYYNKTMLDQAGVGVPTDWDEFLAACRAVKAKHGITPYAASVDASTLDGMVMSFGGELLKADGSAAFEAPAAVDALRVLETLYDEGLGYQVSERGDQNNDFANEQCAMFFRSSTARPYIAELVGDKFEWGMAAMPAGPGREQGTVLFGANICVFRSTPERERLAWQFIQYFSSREVTTHWAQVTGYLPVRHSAAETDELTAFFAEHPRNRVAFDLIPIARPEPNVAGWQTVRECLETAETTLINQLGDAGQVAADLDTCADSALQ